MRVVSAGGQARASQAAQGRPFALGPFRVELQTNVDGFAARWDELFSAFPNAADVTPIRVTVMTDSGGVLRSAVDGETVSTEADPVAHELALTRVLNQRKLDGESALVHLHAASVARSGRGIVLVGKSGDGKSTLTARLIQSGWDYVTDEQVTLDEDGRSILPYPRPLTLRRGVWALFPGIGDDATGDHYRRVETSLQQLGARATQSPVVPTLIVAPRYDDEGATHLEAFSDAGEVVQFLASCCHDLERTRTAGCASLVRLASEHPAYHLRFNDLDTAVDLVNHAFAEARAHLPIPVSRIDTPASQPLVPDRLQRAPGATAWTFDDGSGVAFHPDALRLARLDTLGCALWEALANPDTIDAVLDDAPNDHIRTSLEIWVERLLRAGLLRLP